MNESNDHSHYQLPRSVVPRHYDLLVKPDFASFRFTGRVAIDVDVREPVSRITTHSLGLKISRAHIVNDQGKRHDALAAPAVVSFVDPATVDASEERFTGAAALDAKAQTAVFSFDQTLDKGGWKLVVEFE